MGSTDPPTSARRLTIQRSGLHQCDPRILRQRPSLGTGVQRAASNSSLKMGKDKKAPLVTDESKASRTETSSTTAIVTSSSTTESAGSGGATGLAGARNASWGFLGDLANKGNSAQHRDLNVWMPGQY